MNGNSKHAVWFDYHVDDNRNLWITANNGARAWLADELRRPETCQAWIEAEVFDAANLEPIRPEEVAALTSAPIVASDAMRDDQGALMDAPAVWWFPGYMVDSPLEILRNRGRVRFDLASDA